MIALRHTADLRSLAFVGSALALDAVQWSGAPGHPALLPTACILSFVACVVNHNHQHCRTFTRPVANAVFGCLLSLATGQPATAIVPMHNDNHHVHANTEHDFVRASLVQFRWNLLNLLLFPFLALRGYLKVKRETVARWRRERPELHRQAVLERWVLYPTLTTLLLLRPGATLLHLALPWLFGQWAIVAINLVQHDGCDPSSPESSARNFTGRTLNWLLLNNGYHTAHHLHPGAHWSRLPELHAHLVGPRDMALDHDSFLRTLFELYVWPGRRPARTAPGQEATS